MGVLTRLTLAREWRLYMYRTPTLLVRDLASLLELRVYEARYNEDLVQSLTVPEALPVLQRLVMSLMISPHHRYDLPALAAMIECRWNISHQPVTISFLLRGITYINRFYTMTMERWYVAQWKRGNCPLVRGGWALCGVSEMLQ